jgi:GTP-binding protein Era
MAPVPLTPMDSPTATHKARSGITGYVALLGRPNTGKSTLVNTVLKRHLAAVSAKPQTTRKYLLAIHTDAESQILFLDAPGVHVGKIAIDEAMANSVSRVLEDADLLVCMVDPSREPGEEDLLTAQRAQANGKPAIIAINKVDVATPTQIDNSLAFYRQYLPDAPAVQLVAKDPDRVVELMKQIKSMLPHGIFLYEPDALTDVYERDIAAELIREVLLHELKQEVPHCIAVTVDSWRERERKLHIAATLHIERENHKGIIIGQGGKMIKHLRHHAAKKIAEFCAVPRVNLDLFVKVVPDWRRRKQFLKEIRLLE